MQKKRKSGSRNSGSKAKPYLTKRILKSAVRSGVRQAAETTMEVMGCNVVARNGWVVKVYTDGHIEKITRVPKANLHGGLLLD